MRTARPRGGGDTDLRNALALLLCLATPGCLSFYAAGALVEAPGPEEPVDEPAPTVVPTPSSTPPPPLPETLSPLGLAGPRDGASVPDPSSVWFTWEGGAASAGSVVTVVVLVDGREACRSSGNACNARVEPGTHVWRAVASTAGGLRVESPTWWFRAVGPSSPVAPTPPPPATPAPPAPTEAATQADACASTGDDEASGTDPAAEYDAPLFSWEYGGESWEWAPLIPREWGDYYASRERPDDSLDFGVLATDPYDDAVIGQIACLIRDAAREAGYSEYETVEFTLGFVQSLEYVTDKVGTGFDEWPKFPLETLVDEGGDCEDTSILFATLVRELGYDAVLLDFDHVNGRTDIGHVAVGVYSVSIPGGAYWTLEGRDYYYVETTNSGWGIGDLPDMVEGQKARVLKLAPRAVLQDLTFDAPTYADGLYEFEVRVRNVGSAAVEGLVVWGGWDAGGDLAWSGVTWSEGMRLEPGEESMVTFWLEPPPRNAWTRALFRAWGANAATVTAESGFFRA